MGEFHYEDQLHSFPKCTPERLFVVEKDVKMQEQMVAVYTVTVATGSRAGVAA